MNGPLSDQQVQEWRELEQAATEGPWESYGNAVVNADRAAVALTHRGGWARDASDYQRNADARFITAARRISSVIAVLRWVSS